MPWQLTTKEFLAEVKGVLHPGGVYLMSLLDGRGKFARAEAATMTDLFSDVALFPLGGNNILLASNAPIHLASMTKRLSAERSPAALYKGVQLRRFIGDARVLADDFAPVDQLRD